MLLCLFIFASTLSSICEQGCNRVALCDLRPDFIVIGPGGSLFICLPSYSLARAGEPRVAFPLNPHHVYNEPSATGR